MATECVMIESDPHDPVIRTCAVGTKISKGTLLKLTDPNTVAMADTAGDAFGGWAAADKDAADTSTTIAAHMGGVWDCTGAAGSTVAGTPVKIGGINTISGSNAVNASFVGYAEKTGTAAVIRVRGRGL